ncbi:protein of unknown function DUF86 [Staphylothermus marinus F1]|uniref:DUF86 domain-containing protein n=2 Tax=Staphylothermus marinus TaxID=2280 RepID=A3DPU2_STAMF|nr:protein of unknown function DUF86 [Staphylothermus marinus F1]
MRYSIVLIIESSADLGLYLLRKCFGEEARTYRDVFEKLLRNNVISSETAKGMKSLAFLRNMVVHRYWNVDDEKIYLEAKSNGIQIIEKFIEEVRSHVSKDP